MSAPKAQPPAVGPQAARRADVVVTPLLATAREETGALDPEQAACFERVRVWRNELARAQGKPPYALLTNRQLDALVRAMPTTLAGLRQIEGIGASRVEQWGQALLEVLHPPAQAEDVAHAGGTP